MDYYEFEDGSFIEVISSNKKVEEEGLVSIAGISYFGTYENTYQVNFTSYGYPDPRMFLVSDYTLNRDGITITNTSTEGSGTIFPYDLDASSSVVTANADDRYERAKSQADFRLTAAGWNGVGLIVLYYTILIKF